MKKLTHYLTPPPKWRMPVIVALGIFFGLAAYTIKISNAVSYLSDKPETCINCHVMIPQYAAWNHSSHRERATCNDCHVPHDNVFHKYLFKAQDGMRHATMFTFRLEPQVIRMREAGVAVVVENCKRCHQYMNDNVSAIKTTAESFHQGNNKLCWDCHRNVPHGSMSGLASTPNARVPMKTYPLPNFITKK